MNGAELVGRFAARVKHHATLQSDIFQRSRERIEAHRIADREIILIALVCRQRGKVALGHYLFHDRGSLVAVLKRRRYSLCDLVHADTP